MPQEFDNPLMDENGTPQPCLQAVYSVPRMEMRDVSE